MSLSLKLDFLIKHKYRLAILLGLLSFDFWVKKIAGLLGGVVQTQLGVDTMLDLTLTVIFVLVLFEAKTIKKKHLKYVLLGYCLSVMLLAYLHLMMPIAVIYKGLGVFLISVIFKWCFLFFTLGLTRRLNFFLIVFPVITLGLNFLILSSWGTFSIILLNVINFISEFFGWDLVANVGSNTLAWHGFFVEVGVPCSGVNSLITYLILFVFILKKEVLGKELLGGILYSVGAVMVLFLNVLRIVLLMAIGAFYSKALAINFFHVYSGSVLFMIFVVLYIGFSRRVLVN